MFSTCGGLFVLSWYFFARERPQQPEVSPKPKPAEELLIGVWKSTRESRDPQLQETLEFTRDGKVVLLINDLKEGHVLPIPGFYQFKGKTLQVDYPETANSDFGTWTALVESIDETTLILIQPGGKQQRVVFQRVK